MTTNNSAVIARLEKQRDELARALRKSTDLMCSSMVAIEDNASDHFDWDAAKDAYNEAQNFLANLGSEIKCPFAAEQDEAPIQDKPWYSVYQTEQPAVPERWSLAQKGNMYLVQKYDKNGFIKGEWIEPEQHGHVICELLSDMVQQGGS